MYRRATKGGLIEGGHIPLPKKAFPPCRGGMGKKSTLFCNLAIYKFLGKVKGVYKVFLDIFTISSATYYDKASIL